MFTSTLMDADCVASAAEVATIVTLCGDGGDEKALHDVGGVTVQGKAAPKPTAVYVAVVDELFAVRVPQGLPVPLPLWRTKLDG